MLKLKVIKNLRSWGTYLLSLMGRGAIIKKTSLPDFASNPPRCILSIIVSEGIHLREVRKIKSQHACDINTEVNHNDHRVTLAQSQCDSNLVPLL